MDIKQQNHIDLMEGVLSAFSDKPLVLKGGTALLLGYGLDRFSEDLDFDISKSFNGRPPVGGLEKLLLGVKTKNCKVVSVNVKKNTSTVTRFMVDYLSGDQKEKLKIEISYRTPLENQKINNINGIKFLPLSDIADFKLNTVLGENSYDRTSARDLYDASFIVTKHPSILSDELLDKIKKLDMDFVNARYAKAFDDDLIFKKMGVKSIDVVLNLSEAVEKEISKRNQINEEDKKLVNEARENRAEQDALIEAQYESTLSAYVLQKHEQVERLEDRLENLVEGQQARLQQALNSRPGFLATPQTRKLHSAQLAKIRSKVVTLENRLETIKEIKDEIAMNSPRIMDMAVRKLQHEHPELKRSFDEMRRAQREHELLQKQKKKKQQELSQKNTRAKKLTRDRDM